MFLDFFQAYENLHISLQEVGDQDKNLILKKKFEKKGFGLGKKSFGTNTKIGLWFQLPIPKLGFGHTLVSSADSALKLA